MSDARKPARYKRSRERYSRLICIGCRERRIRCELPCEVEVPNAGELRTIDTPCYRCKRLSQPCVVRQTILGRPGPERNSTTACAGFQPATTGDIVPDVVIDLALRTPGPTQSAVLQGETRLADRSAISRTTARSPDVSSPNEENPTRWQSDALQGRVRSNSRVHPLTRQHYSSNFLPSRDSPACLNADDRTLLVHTPQSTERVLILRAVDTLRREHVEEEWFRHLASYAGYAQHLDLSVKALVAACAYGRGVPRLTSNDCYQALGLALSAVKASIEHSHGKPPDDAILASTALLAPFEGVIRRNGILTCSHVEGLAAILAARPATYPVTPIAREIVNFHAAESAIMACIQGTLSPFEDVDRSYFGSSDSDRAQLRTLANELFIRIPRLARLVRSLRLQKSPQLLLDALRISKSLLTLQDCEVEGRLSRSTAVQRSGDSDATSPLDQSLRFASVKDFEALAYYWQSRLYLLRLDSRLQGMSVMHRPNADPKTNEMPRLAKNILMCSEYAGTLLLRTHNRLFAHAMVVVWGLKKDMPAALSDGKDGGLRTSLANLMLRSVNAALLPKPELTVEDMDTAAEIFVGGQPRGRFAELFRL